MKPQTLVIGSRTLAIRRASAAEIIPLRHRILRAGLPLEAAHFPGDNDATTIHAGAFEAAAAIGCASMMLSAWEGEPAWQLRGMATEEGWQGKGIGQAVLGHLMALAVGASEPPVRLFWCNARVPALRFYARLGWEVMSEEFEIPTAGPHRKLMKRCEI